MKSPRDYFKNSGIGIDPISKSCTADETCSHLWSNLSVEDNITDNFVQSSDDNPILAADADISIGESAIVIDNPSVDKNILDPASITSEQCDLSGDVATIITDLSITPISDLRGCNNLDTDADPTNALLSTGTSQLILIQGAEQSQVFYAYAVESTCSNKCGEVKSCISVKSGIIKSPIKASDSVKRPCSRVARRNYPLSCEFMKLNTSP
jgi:hypothetical protein